MENTFFVFCAFLSITAGARTGPAPQNGPGIYPAWTLFVPGATHFYDARIMEGLLFSGIEIGGIAAGIAYNDKLRSQSSSPYYNFPLLLGMQAFNIDKCDLLRNRLQAVKYHRPGFNYDSVRFNDLLASPFKPRNIFTPITAGLVCAAIVELCIDARYAGRGFREVDKMYFVNHYMDRDPALAAYGATSLAAGYGAGISEEYLFRNGFMPLWDCKYGQRKGLIFSSLLFGTIHFGNLLFSNKPDYRAALIQVGEASVLGYFLGRDVQKRGYTIGPAVAAHTWYDFTLLLGSFLVDPENNFLGVNVKFNL